MKMRFSSQAVFRASSCKPYRGIRYCSSPRKLLSSKAAHSSPFTSTEIVIPPSSTPGGWFGAALGLQPSLQLSVPRSPGPFPDKSLAVTAPLKAAVFLAISAFRIVFTKLCLLPIRERNRRTMVLIARIRRSRRLNVRRIAVCSSCLAHCLENFWGST